MSRVESSLADRWRHHAQPLTGWQKVYLKPKIVKAWIVGKETVVTGNMRYRDATWPELPLSAWKDTYATLHLWTQIVGKIRLAQTPWLNHSWHVVLYVSARGLTTSAIPYGDRSFQLDFDFLDHVLRAFGQRRRSRGDRALPAPGCRFLCRGHGLPR